MKINEFFQKYKIAIEINRNRSIIFIFKFDTNKNL